MILGVSTRKIQYKLHEYGSTLAPASGGSGAPGDRDDE
jgi:hypothetical protein